MRGVLTEAISFDNARKMSRTKDENDVKDPQKPVARPIYSGIVFFTDIRARFAAKRSILSSVAD